MDKYTEAVELLKKQRDENKRLKEIVYQLIEEKALEYTYGTPVPFLKENIGMSDEEIFDLWLYPSNRCNKDISLENCDECCWHDDGYYADELYRCVKKGE